MGAWRAAALAAEFGFSVAGSMAAGVIAGQLLDRWLGTAPGFFLAGLACGFITSIYLMYVIYRLQVVPRSSGRKTGDGAGTPHRSQKDSQRRAAEDGEHAR